MTDWAFSRLSVFSAAKRCGDFMNTACFPCRVRIVMKTPTTIFIVVVVVVVVVVFII